MGRSITSMMAVFAVILVAGLSVGWGQQATVKLLSPKDGEVIGSSMLIQWEFKEAGDIDHIHLYLDGRNPGPPFGTSMQLVGLSNGPHVVRIVAANTRHQEVGPEISAKVTVNGRAVP
ncbi:MAG: hypothetical protein C3F12_03315 [Candidatus Methylomirabilota bacterium]|nr:hypothetical protein [Candidatus Methylomirabilis sp.]NJD67680.1 hypothetical protein [candidate division NC10 bacterium]PWB47989.1 MAG: hypothetical protein C3F12_03315 [candidate division NC10 bacterium]